MADCKQVSGWVFWFGVFLQRGGRCFFVGEVGFWGFCCVFFGGFFLVGFGGFFEFYYFGSFFSV